MTRGFFHEFESESESWLIFRNRSRSREWQLRVVNRESESARESRVVVVALDFTYRRLDKKKRPLNF